MENNAWLGGQQPQAPEPQGQQPQAPADQEMPLYPPPQAAYRLPDRIALYPLSTAEWLLTAAYTAVGFLFFECRLADGYYAGIGTSLFFLLALASTLVFLIHSNIRQNKVSWLLFSLAAIGSLQYVAYGRQTASIYILGFVFQCSLCLLWLAYSCRTLIALPLTWLLAFDCINQYFIVPFANLPMVFRRLFLKGEDRRGFNLMIVIIALCVSLPVLLLVIRLLESSDEGFSYLMAQIRVIVNLEAFKRWCGNLVLGLPLASCLLGVCFGNVTQHQTQAFKKDSLLGSFASLHRLIHIAALVPLSLFVLVYLVYIAAMSAYLFSAFTAKLPDGFTYAEYARQGFFELIAVTVINTFLLAVLWSVAKREKGTYPATLKAYTAILALLTLVLIITAASKMYLYVQTYNLSILRFYTSCFMFVLAVSYVLLLAWSIRPFNLAKPVISLFIGSFLIITLVSPPAIIANYNSSRYLAGQTINMDVRELQSYGPVALPSLERLADQAPDSHVRAQARDAVASVTELNGHQHWYSWNILYLIMGIY